MAAKTGAKLAARAAEKAAGKLSRNRAKKARKGNERFTAWRGLAA